MAPTPPSTPPPRIRPRRPVVRIPLLTRRSPSSSLSPQTPTFPANPFNSGNVQGRLMIKWRDNPAYPSTLDKWIQANISLWPRADPRLPTTEMFPDEVMCKLKKVYRPPRLDPEPDSIFLDDVPNFILILTVSMSPDSGVLIWGQESPPAILERYDGWDEGPENVFAPDWSKIMENNEEICFKQPRALIGELFAWLAMEPANVDEGLSEPMLRWAESISVVHKARSAIKLYSNGAKYAAKKRPRTPSPSRRSLWPYEHTQRTRSSRFRDTNSFEGMPRLHALELGTAGRVGEVNVATGI